MKRRELYSKAWCDLIFEGKNKEYGAYYLRRRSAYFHCKALAILGGGLVAIIGLPLLVQVLLSSSLGDLEIGNLAEFDEGVVIKEANLPLPSIRQRRKELEETKQQTTEDAQSNNQSEPQPNNEVPDNANLPFGIDNNMKSILSEISPLDTVRMDGSLPTATANEQFTGIVMDDFPSFPGGVVALMRWLDKTTVYPPMCIREKIEGMVKIEFSILPDGSVDDPQLTALANPALNSEALRVVRMLPKWNPPRNYAAKPVRITLPFDFKLH